MFLNNLINILIFLKIPHQIFLIWLLQYDLIISYCPKKGLKVTHKFWGIFRLLPFIEKYKYIWKRENLTINFCNIKKLDHMKMTFSRIMCVLDFLKHFIEYSQLLNGLFLHNIYFLISIETNNTIQKLLLFYSMH